MIEAQKWRIMVNGMDMHTMCSCVCMCRFYIIVYTMEYVVTSFHVQILIDQVFTCIFYHVFF